jgi:prenylcysteine oxidase/farnesylcysteine lyase
MLFAIPTLIAGLPSQLAYYAHQDASLENPLIAVIGAGIASASAAYHLHLAASSNTSITIFESESRIGGEIVSLPIPDTNSRTFFETGGSHFFTDDECLVETVPELGLQLKEYRGYGSDEFRKTSGVWDGKKMTGTPLLVQQLRSWLDKWGLTWLMEPVRLGWNTSNWDIFRTLWLRGFELDPILQASCELESYSWWRRIYMRWEYGSSPARFSRAMRSVSEKWNALGRENFDNVGIIKQSGADYLTGTGISERFQNEVIQPCVRARFALSLAEVRGLDAIMAWRDSKETSVLEGNIRLIEEIITRSRANLQLNSKVTDIVGEQQKDELVNLLSSEV